jgi:lipopolysaccharide transport system permease protein
MYSESASTSRPLNPVYTLEGAANIWSDWHRLATLVKHLTLRNLAVRYRGSALGFVWSLLNPVLLMAVYSFVFRYVFQISVPGIPYPVFFFTGLLAWNFVSVGSMSAAVSLLEGKALISKTSFPREALPISAVCSSSVNYLMSVPILVLFNVLFGVVPTRTFLLFPVALLLLFLMALGVGLLLAAVIPLFRDLQHLIEVLFVCWFLLTPVLYQTEQVSKGLPNKVLVLYALNPMVGIMDFVHSVFLGQPLPGALLGIGLTGVVAFVIVGLLVFRRFAPRVCEI